MGIAKHRKHTNKDFKDNFVNLASKDTQKGHLTKQKRQSDDVQSTRGILKHVIIDRIDSNGWIVEVGSGSNISKYPCTNPDWSTTLPDSTETNTMYVPKNKTEVEISIDKHSKIYSITRFIKSNSSLSNYQDTLKISIDQNTKTNMDVNAEITLTSDSIELGANKIIVNNNNKKIDLVETQQSQADQIQILVDENTILKEKINNIESQLNQNTSNTGD